MSGWHIVVGQFSGVGDNVFWELDLLLSLHSRLEGISSEEANPFSWWEGNNCFSISMTVDYKSVKYRDALCIFSLIKMLVTGVRWWDKFTFWPKTFFVSSSDWKLYNFFHCLKKLIEWKSSNRIIYYFKRLKQIENLPIALKKITQPPKTSIDRFIFSLSYVFHLLSFLKSSMYLERKFRNLGFSLFI